jgi:hypothetical protein
MKVQALKGAAQLTAVFGKKSAKATAVASTSR